MNKENKFFIHHKTDNNNVEWKINEGFFKPSLLCKAYDYARQRLSELYPGLFECNNIKGPGENEFSNYLVVKKSSELLDDLLAANAA